MIHNYIATPDIEAYSAVVTKLREFFHGKGFVEVHTQDRLSILAACEDPTTVATYEYAGQVWPLPQTGQMWLEYELLTKPELSGVFCVSTSYRAEQNPVEGRHKIIFPMFEFESKGTIDELRTLEEELLAFLGYKRTEGEYPHASWGDMAKRYDTEDLTSEHEKMMEKELGAVTFLERFPEHTSPFWNMMRAGDGTAHKIDVILSGMETIGSAERATDPVDMRERFMTISGGGYANLLYEKFGRERVQKELDDFLALPFIPRYGGGIGMTRLIDSMKKEALI